MLITKEPGRQSQPEPKKMKNYEYLQQTKHKNFKNVTPNLHERNDAFFLFFPHKKKKKKKHSPDQIQRL